MLWRLFSLLKAWSYIVVAKQIALSKCIKPFWKQCFNTTLTLTRDALMILEVGTLTILLWRDWSILVNSLCELLGVFGRRLKEKAEGAHACTAQWKLLNVCHYWSVLLLYSLRLIAFSSLRVLWQFNENIKSQLCFWFKLTS